MLWPDRNQSVCSIQRKFEQIHHKNPDSECSTGNTSGEASDSSDGESWELPAGQGGGDKIGNDKDDSNMEYAFGVIKRKRKDEVLKKKEEKKPAKKKDCLFKFQKEKKEMLKLHEDAKKELDRKTMSQQQQTRIRMATSL
eukprot:12358597-Ditylum_brightwellii.AAC.1